MKYIILLIVALGSFHGGYSTDPHYWLAKSRPYFEREMGVVVPSYSLEWGTYSGAGGWTYVLTNGCVSSMGLNVRFRGTPIVPFFTLHEFAHVHQGFLCLGSWVRMEQSASLLAIEVLAEMCLDGHGDACDAFWYAIYDRAYGSLYRPFKRENYQAYQSGVLDAILESRNGPVAGAVSHRPLYLDHTWALLGPKVEQYLEGTGRMR